MRLRFLDYRKLGSLHFGSMSRAVLNGVGSLAFWMLFASPGSEAGEHSEQNFRKHIQPILAEYCYDCHGDGTKKGGIAFDELNPGNALQERDLWLKVIKNLRAGLMPPEKKPHPSADQIRQIVDWIKYDAFGIDPENPDPGSVALHRMNRTEYSNTIRDLMGVEFPATEEFPPDDTGYGFDNIGDVLTMSPILMEKYVRAAETIVAEAVPTVSKVVREFTIPGKEFVESEDSKNNTAASHSNSARSLSGESPLINSFYAPFKVFHEVSVDVAGDYQLVLNLTVRGAFDFDPGRCRLIFRVDDREVWQEDFKWQDRKKYRPEIASRWLPGKHSLSFELQPLTPVEEKQTSVDMQILSVDVLGPLAPESWIRPENYSRFFSRDEPPQSAEERREYARDLLASFASKAFRRRVEPATIDRLASFAESFYRTPGKRFEEGIARAMVAVLASPRFLFRVEEVQSPVPGEKYPLVDEYALASRLSYFLWSTMPDEELLNLAGKGQLRINLSSQIERMLTHKRSSEFVGNFVGQWLQVRDLEGIQIDARTVLARDQGRDRQMERDRNRFTELRKIPEDQLTPEQAKELDEIRAGFRRRFRAPTVELNRELRQAMRRETEMLFDYVMREDRSVIELIDSDYTFLNERLAKHYGVSGVAGDEMQKVALPVGSPRGGVLTHGSVLIVTSNPTRTSPVKRGLFVLDNILGIPPPPPPADVPALEESEKEIADHEPTLKEVLEAHRNKPLCASCHSRMDPLGLALENFNALAMWRDKERGMPIETPGKLITGEPFEDVRELKRILAKDRRADFYRCLTEKLLTYALGRGLDYFDIESVDQIVARLENGDGRFSSLLSGIIESAPFQRKRDESDQFSAKDPESEKQIAGK
ncbi:MAG: DUF1592 domain-containing protein [Verrucomicrobia bacterium]|nr:DUF1592 domain-containing protein [Verrucomicrobiota bacterium]